MSIADADDEAASAALFGGKEEKAQTPRPPSKKSRSAAGAEDSDSDKEVVEKAPRRKRGSEGGDAGGSRGKKRLKIKSYADDEAGVDNDSDIEDNGDGEIADENGEAEKAARRLGIYKSAKRSASETEDSKRRKTEKREKCLELEKKISDIKLEQRKLDSELAKLEEEKTALEKGVVILENSDEDEAEAEEGPGAFDLLKFLGEFDKKTVEVESSEAELVSRDAEATILLKTVTGAHYVGSSGSALGYDVTEAGKSYQVSVTCKENHSAVVVSQNGKPLYHSLIRHAKPVTRVAAKGCSWNSFATKLFACVQSDFPKEIPADSLILAFYFIVNCSLPLPS